jgi:hypothetical protein
MAKKSTPSGLDLIHKRLRSQALVDSPFTKPAQLVDWMGCIQSQDYAQAKWALGLRVPGLTEMQVDSAFNAGVVLRTHVLRPTWHFVLPADIRWMLSLTAPRIKAFSAGMHRKLELDQKTLTRAKKVLEKELSKHGVLTRNQILPLFQKAKIRTDDIRSSFLLIDAELDGLICSGPRIGKQFTYALMDARVPQGRDLKGDQALAELAWRYFRSRGPATIHDFAWWSGLTIGHGKRAIDILTDRLEHIVLNGQAYWAASLDRAPIASEDFAAPGARAAATGSRVSGTSRAATSGSRVFLLPAFDEFTVAYKDRSDILHSEHYTQAAYGLKPVILAQDQIQGTWRRELQKKEIVVETQAFEVFGKGLETKITKEVKRFKKFAS